MQLLRPLAVIIIAPFLLASSASTWIPTDDEDCEVIMLFGDDEAENLTDRCTAANQNGDDSDDVTKVGNVQCDASLNPPGRTDASDSCDFDGNGDYLEFPVDHFDTDGEPNTSWAWIYPEKTANTYVYGNRLFSAPVNEKGFNQLLRYDAAGYDSWSCGESGCEFSDSKSIPGSAWSGAGAVWDIGVTEEKIPYNSRAPDANTMRDCDANCTSGAALANQSLSYRIGAGHTSLDYDGRIAEFFLFERALSDEEMCQLCRCGFANDPGADPNDVVADRANECNECTLPNSATHCGPRRIM